MQFNRLKINNFSILLSFSTRALIELKTLCIEVDFMRLTNGVGLAGQFQTSQKYENKEPKTMTSTNRIHYALKARMEQPNNSISGKRNKLLQYS